MRRLSLMMHICFGGLTLIAVGCQTVLMWDDACSDTLHVRSEHPLVVDQRGRPVALAVPYRTSNRFFSYWVHVPLDEDGSPSDLVEVSGPEAFTEISQERLGIIAARLTAQLRASARSSSLVRSDESTSYDETSSHWREGVMISGYALRTDAASSKKVFFYAVPMALQRDQRQQLNDVFVAAIASPLVLTLDLLGPVGAIIGYGLGIFPWPP